MGLKVGAESAARGARCANPGEIIIINVVVVGDHWNENKQEKVGNFGTRWGYSGIWSKHARKH